MDIISFMSIVLLITFVFSLFDALAGYVLQSRDPEAGLRAWRQAYFWLMGSTLTLFTFSLITLLSLQGGSP